MWRPPALRQPSSPLPRRHRCFSTRTLRAARLGWLRPRVEALEDRVLLSTSIPGSGTDPAALPEMPAPLHALFSGERPSSVPAGMAGRIEERLWSVVEHLRPGLAGSTAFPGQPDARTLLASGQARINSHGQIQTYIHLARWDAAAVAQVESLGIVVEASSAAMRAVQAWVSADRVDDVARLPAVRSVGLPDYAVHHTGSVNSAGDAIHRADEVRRQFAAQGIDGSGVRVGVLSDGADHRADVAASPYLDLPTNITIDPARPGTGDEGTAMLEIIYDLAPGASLYFSGPNTSIEMINAIDWMISQEVNVLVDDNGFYLQPFFADGPLAQAVADAVARGVTYVTTAGNDALRHYQVPYVQGGALGNGFVHDFGGFDIGLDLTIPAGGRLDVVCQWSDPFGGSANDYDLILARSADFEILGVSDRLQAGAQDPWEVVSYINTAPSSLQVFVTILKYNGLPRELELFVFGAASQEYVTAADSIFGHGAVPEVVTVGAINAEDPENDDIAFYSSRGPSAIYTDFAAQTRILRDSLDGAGIDGVETKVGQLDHFRNPFLGTSAAAAHVAAIAALLRDANPTLTPAALASILETTAMDLTSYATGYDHTSGFGRFDALAAVLRALSPSAPIPPDDRDTDGTTPPTATDTAPVAALLGRASAATGTAAQPAAERRAPPPVRTAAVDHLFASPRKADGAFFARSRPADPERAEEWWTDLIAAALAPPRSVRTLDPG
ncbi:MAG: S8 family serine peptidase [Gemmataceae bacterium]|nr:S8 family serine peptidase [Gemmataceae bacterium]